MPTPSTLNANANPLRSEIAVAHLMSVMSDLISTVETENDFLTRGMPAALSALADCKDGLTHQFVDVSRSVMATCAAEIAADEQLRQQIVGTGEVLRSITQENMRLLRQAMSATQRRIDTVMAAIRAEAGGQGTYGGKGTPSTVNFVEGNVRFRA